MFSSNHRKGWDPCARAGPRQDPKQIDQDYEQPTVTAETTVTCEDTPDYQYAELDEPNFAGYKKPDF